MNVVSIPAQREHEPSEPRMFVMEPDSPEEIHRAVAEFVSKAKEQPGLLLSTLLIHGTPSSPNGVITEAVLGDPDPERSAALEFMAQFLENRFDTYVDYDDETVDHIRRKTEIDWPSPRTRILAAYLGRLVKMQQVNADTPDSQAA